MEETDFFDLLDPAQKKAFEHHLDGIEPMGGGDMPENALEAPAHPLRSRRAA